MATLHLKVITPEKIVLEDEVEEVIITTPDGEIGILPHHVNLMSQVIAGEMRVKSKGKTIPMVTGTGLLQMIDNNLSILTDLAQRAEEIDEKIAEEARKRAQAALGQTLSDEEYAETVAVLEKSLAQLKVKRRHQVR